MNERPKKQTHETYGGRGGKMEKLYIYIKTTSTERDEARDTEAAKI